LRDFGQVVDEVVAAYRAPVGCVEAGTQAARRGAQAMIDISDGLICDADRIARASGVILDIDPRASVLAGQASRLRPLAVHLGRPVRDWVLAGGEDHALLAVFPLGTLLPEDFVPIGAARAVDLGGARVLVDGQKVPQGLGGWDHFHR
jgi:thiamine-monophosphate kinase